MSLEGVYIDELYKVLAKIDDVGTMKEFLNDLCTYKEIEQMAQRLETAKLLLENKTYEEIIKKTEISSATLSRVSKCVKYSEGYKKVLKND
jgi:TrpR-related protein YerC/YecD